VGGSGGGDRRGDRGGMRGKGRRVSGGREVWGEEVGGTGGGKGGGGEEEERGGGGCLRQVRRGWAEGKGGEKEGGCEWGGG